MLTVFLIGAFVVGVVALLERANRRTDAFDVAPGRIPVPGAARVQGETRALVEPAVQEVATCTVPGAEATRHAPRSAA